MHRRHSDSRTFQIIRRYSHNRSTRRPIQLRHLTCILTYMRRLSTPTILTTLIIRTTHIIQPHIFMALRLVFFLAIPFTTALAVTMGIGVIAGTAKLTRPTRSVGDA